VNHYIHQIPGRLRIKSPVLRNGKYHPGVRELLSSLKGIEAAELNPTTGSVTIYYHPAQIHGKDIEKAFERHGYFDRSKAITNDQYFHNLFSKAGHVVSRALFGSAAGVALEGTGLSFLTVLI
jgi:hypothetical protein